MAGIDCCMELVEKKGKELFGNYANKLMDFYRDMEKLKRLRVLTKDVIKLNMTKILDIDPSKIVISCRNTNITGDELYYILLDNYKIQVEMASTDYVIAMTSIGDSVEGFNRLRNALFEIDDQLCTVEIKDPWETKNIVLDIELSPYEAYNREGKLIPQSQAEGMISKEYAYLYPPGIPLLVPGERITKECLELFQYYKEHNLIIKGLDKAGYIQVVSG
jgi:arginine/lysine/ornithine decarboxylase